MPSSRRISSGVLLAIFLAKKATETSRRVLALRKLAAIMHSRISEFFMFSKKSSRSVASSLRFQNLMTSSKVLPSTYKMGGRGKKVDGLRVAMKIIWARRGLNDKKWVLLTYLRQRDHSSLQAFINKRTDHRRTTDGERLRDLESTGTGGKTGCFLFTLSEHRGLNRHITLNNTS